MFETEDAHAPSVLCRALPPAGVSLELTSRLVLQLPRVCATTWICLQVGEVGDLGAEGE
jgi:hypothetical protein